MARGQHLVLVVPPPLIDLDDLAVLRLLEEPGPPVRGDVEQLHLVGVGLGCLAGALARALRGCSSAAADPVPARDLIPVASLLPAGREVLAVIPGRVELGFRAFKWKVGAGDPADAKDTQP